MANINVPKINAGKFYGSYFQVNKLMPGQGLKISKPVIEALASYSVKEILKPENLPADTSRVILGRSHEDLLTYRFGKVAPTLKLPEDHGVSLAVKAITEAVESFVGFKEEEVFVHLPEQSGPYEPLDRHEMEVSIMKTYLGMNYDELIGQVTKFSKPSYGNYLKDLAKFSIPVLAIPVATVYTAFGGLVSILGLTPIAVGMAAGLLTSIASYILFRNSNQNLKQELGSNLEKITHFAIVQSKLFQDALNSKLISDEDLM